MGPVFFCKCLQCNCSATVLATLPLVSRFFVRNLFYINFHFCFKFLIVSCFFPGTVATPFLGVNIPNVHTWAASPKVWVSIQVIVAIHWTIIQQHNNKGVSLQPLFTPRWSWSTIKLKQIKLFIKTNKLQHEMYLFTGRHYSRAYWISWE